MKFIYTKHNHSVGDNFHHLQWNTKYRYNMFSKFKYKNLADACIRKSCKRYNIQIIALTVMPDHVHLIANLPTNLSVDKAMQLIKGYSAYIFFRAHPKARLRYPRGHLWSRGKFRSSIGYVSVPDSISYVLNQEETELTSLTGNLGL